MASDRIGLDDLKGAPRNPKGHDLDEIKASILRWGFQGGVIVWGDTDELVAGHGRTAALRALKADGVDPFSIGIGVDRSGEWLVPAHRGEFASRQEAEGYLLADNRLTELGAWDNGQQLASMLADLDDFAGTGFTQADMDALADALADANPVAPPSASEGDPSAIGDRYEVVVECASEKDMEKVYNRMTKEGYQCRTLLL